MAIMPEIRASGFPFNYTRGEYADALRAIPTRDLLAEIESWQWLALEVADLLDGSRDYVEHQLEAMVAEAERRRRLWERSPDDPLRPAWDAPDAALRQRIAAVKAAWPIERFCREVLLCEMIPTGQGRFKARCPLPGHPDSSPSFVVYPDGHAWCFGCNRGGNVIKLAQYVGNLARFTDALAWLEREGGRA